jgi:uncharacterized membrane protein
LTVLKLHQQEQEHVPHLQTPVALVLVLLLLVVVVTVLLLLLLLVIVVVVVAASAAGRPTACLPHPQQAVAQTAN